jgi:hypothetical protein
MRLETPYTLIMYLFLTALMLNSEVVLGACVKFPRDAEVPAVEVCDNDDVYSFQIGDMKRLFDKSAFAMRAKAAALEWLSDANESVVMDESFPIQIWMTVPMANPAAAQPRMIIPTSRGNVSFWLDLDAVDWRFQDRESAILEKTDYPNSFGHRPGVVLVEAKSGIDPYDLEQSLLDRGATRVTQSNVGSFEVQCKIFDEKSFATSAGQLSSMVKYAQVNSVMEWIADRQLVFAIPVNP